LVLGTAFPHLLKDLTGALAYRFVILSTSGIALMGGLLMLAAVPDGPYRKAGQRLDLTASLKVFRNPGLRSAAFGYFGHMWELYAFWTFIPVILKTYSINNPESTFNIPAFSFLIIGIGGISCVIGGYLSLWAGPAKIAFVALLISCLFCIISPFLFGIRSNALFIACLLIWGMAVVADSPLFSTMVADNANPEIKGTALTIVNCIGFSITIISIQIINGLQHVINQNNIYIILALGPVLGLTALANPKTKKY
jgi:MFS family permease